MKRHRWQDVGFGFIPRCRNCQINRRAGAGDTSATTCQAFPMLGAGAGLACRWSPENTSVSRGRLIAAAWLLNLRWRRPPVDCGTPPLAGDSTVHPRRMYRWLARRWTEGRANRFAPDETSSAHEQPHPRSANHARAFLTTRCHYRRRTGPSSLQQNPGRKLQGGSDSRIPQV